LESFDRIKSSDLSWKKNWPSLSSTLFYSADSLAFRTHLDILHPIRGLTTNLFITGALIGLVSLLYETAGQAGGTAFPAIMGLASFPAEEMRPTALFLN
jgi:hypothetical protein